MSPTCTPLALLYEICKFFLGIIFVIIIFLALKIDMLSQYLWFFLHKIQSHCIVLNHFCLTLVMDQDLSAFSCMPPKYNSYWVLSNIIFFVNAQSTRIQPCHMIMKTYVVWFDHSNYVSEWVCQVSYPHWSRPSGVPHGNYPMAH